jgi:starch synthase
MQMIDKIKFDNIEEGIINVLQKPSYINLMKIAVDHSDGLIIGSEEIPKELEDYLKKCKKPVLKFQSKEEFAENYKEFYSTKLTS